MTFEYPTGEAYTAWEATIELEKEMQDEADQDLSDCLARQKIKEGKTLIF